MPRRREGPTKNKATEYFFFDEYIGFPPDKKRIRISLRTKDPAKAQWLWEQEYKKQWSEYYGIESKKHRQPIKFFQARKEYVDYEKDIKKIKEWKLYEARLRIVGEVWGNIPLKDVSHEHFVKLDKYLKSKKRSEKTINHYFTLLKALFNYSTKKHKLGIENPVNEIKPYVTDRKRREYTPEEISRILKAADRIEKEASNRAYIMRYAKRITLMLLYTAMRPGELFKLQWDKHIKDDKIVLERSETKQKKEKVIPITDSIRKVLESLHKEKDKSGYVFPFQSRTNRNSVWTGDIAKKIKKYTGIKDFLFYNLKHTAASIMVSQALGRGASISDVMKILGHSQIDTTMQYVHSDFSRMKKAMSALEDAVERLPSKSSS